MSGGYFDYQQYKINDIADDIESALGSATEDVDEEVKPYFVEAIKTLRKAAVMAQRVDWYLSGDDGLESFLQRWGEDLARLEAQ